MRKKDINSFIYLKGLPKTKEEAIAKGINCYFDGIMCSKGHTVAKLTSKGTCEQCSKEHQSRYRHKKEVLANNSNSASNRNRISDIVDTGEFKETWEE